MKTPLGSTRKLRFRFGAASANDFIDVRPKKSRKLFVMIFCGSILLALLAAWVWQGPFQSWQDGKEVEKFLVMNDPGATISTREKLERQNLQKNPVSVRMYLTGKFIESGRGGDDSDGKAIDEAQ